MTNTKVGKKGLMMWEKFVFDDTIFGNSIDGYTITSH